MRVTQANKVYDITFHGWVIDPNHVSLQLCLICIYTPEIWKSKCQTLQKVTIYISWNIDESKPSFCKITDQPNIKGSPIKIADNGAITHHSS